MVSDAALKGAKQPVKDEHKSVKCRFAAKGTDLQRRTDAALLERMKKCTPATEDVSRVMVCFPDQGHLGPYDKTTVEIRFSPLRKRYFVGFCVDFFFPGKYTELVC